MRTITITLLLIAIIATTGCATQRAAKPQNTGSAGTLVTIQNQVMPISSENARPVKSTTEKDEDAKNNDDRFAETLTVTGNKVGVTITVTGDGQSAADVARSDADTTTATPTTEIKADVTP